MLYPKILLTVRHISWIRMPWRLTAGQSDTSNAYLCWRARLLCAYEALLDLSQTCAITSESVSVSRKNVWRRGKPTPILSMSKQSSVK